MTSALRKTPLSVSFSVGWLTSHVTTLRMRTEMVLETSVCSSFNHSTRLITRKNFTVTILRESARSHIYGYQTKQITLQLFRKGGVSSSWCSVCRVIFIYLNILLRLAYAILFVRQFSFIVVFNGADVLLFNLLGIRFDCLDGGSAHGNMLTSTAKQKNVTHIFLRSQV
jgi:hypothetical protein